MEQAIWISIFVSAVAIAAALIGIPLYFLMRWRNPDPSKRNRQQLIAGIIGCVVAGCVAAGVLTGTVAELMSSA